MTNDIPTVVVTPIVPTVVITAPGPQGPAGNSASIFYIFNQATPSSVWTINHNLNGYPALTVFDSANSECVGTINYVDTNNLTLTFSTAFSGTAYLV